MTAAPTARLFLFPESANRAASETGLVRWAAGREVEISTLVSLFNPWSRATLSNTAIAHGDGRIRSRGSNLSPLGQCGPVDGSAKTFGARARHGHICRHCREGSLKRGLLMILLLLRSLTHTECNPNLPRSVVQGVSVKFPDMPAKKPLCRRSATRCREGEKKCKILLYSINLPFVTKLRGHCVAP